MAKIPSCKHDTGDPDHIMIIQTKVSLALIAQGKDDTDMWDQDKEITMLTTWTSTAQLMMEAYSHLAVKTVSPNQEVMYT